MSTSESIRAANAQKDSGHRFDMAPSSMDLLGLRAMPGTPPTLHRMLSSDTPISQGFSAYEKSFSINSPSFDSLSRATGQSLTIEYATIKHSIIIPNEAYSTALHLRDEFLKNFVGESTDPESSLVDFFAHFMEFAVNKGEAEFGRTNELYKTIFAVLLETFEHSILCNKEIHGVVKTLSVTNEQKASIIAAYFRTRYIVGDYSPTPSALFTAAKLGKARIYTVFGGQGNDEHYFDEIREIYHTYHHLIDGFVASATDLLRQLSADENYRRFYYCGLNVKSWLEQKDYQPATEYLISAPVSMPLIGLLQLLHYKVTSHLLGCSPLQMRSLIAGAAGHSQGTITAAVIAMADSWASYDDLTLKALRILVAIGARSQQYFAVAQLSPTVVEDAENHGEGLPAPMLGVRGHPIHLVEAMIKEVNSHLNADAKIELALVNGAENAVIAGPPLSLHGFNLWLRSVKAGHNDSQAKIAFGQRKPKIKNRFLPITVPFHSSYLTGVAATVMEDVADIIIKGEELRFPVYNTSTGEDLRTRNAQNNILFELVRMITDEKLDWRNATRFPGATHILDFGPGKVSGIGSLTHRNKEGTGVRTILATVLQGVSRDVGYKSEILDWDEANGLVWSAKWATTYAPRVVHSNEDGNGTRVLETKMTRMLHLPPVMVAGMTPTTVSPGFVIAAMNAGYHIELALGGYLNPTELKAAITKIVAHTPVGRGLTCNIIYASVHSVRWQIPLLAELRASGVPIDGLTIGAGVPSVEIARSYIKDIGLKHIGFKPGSVEAIQQVVDIARQNSGFPIIVQWTGGRGGGHHSYEDFHQPILDSYSLIRTCPNIILVAGSGFGGHQDCFPYISGEWALAFDRPHMPFDGVLFGSRVMVAKEAKTSPAVKQLIVRTPGVEDAVWEETYTRPSGGVITIISEMGEPIHAIATRGVQLWAELDETIFKMRGPQMVAELNRKRDYIINQLNLNYQKVWFGKSFSGKPVNLSQMSYSEVLQRLLELFYVEHEARWIDESLKKFFIDFLLRTATRTTSVETASMVRRIAGNTDMIDGVRHFFDTHKEFASQMITAQDEQYFLMLCKRKGQKPVPFIPILDEDFQSYFKKDSLWQSEDLESVAGQDVERIMVLQGPVATRYSTIANEPIKEILDIIHDGLMDGLLETGICKDKSSTIPTISPEENFLTLEEVASNGIIITSTEDYQTFEVSKEQDSPSPTLDQWLACLGGQDGGWRQAIFTSRTIMQERNSCENPIRRLFIPSPDSYVLIRTNGASGPIISVFEIQKSGDPAKVVEITSPRQHIISLHIIHHTNRGTFGLDLHYTYHQEAEFAPIREVMEGRNQRIKDFYYKVWFPYKGPVPTRGLRDTFTDEKTQVSSDAIAEFAYCVRNFSDASTARVGKKLYAPLDFAVVVGWEALMKPLFSQDLDADLLSLIHLSNGFRMVENATPIQSGDILSTSSQVDSVTNGKAGKLVEISGHVYRDDIPILALSSQFLFCGTYLDDHNSFRRVKENDIEVVLSSPKDVAVLRSKSWFKDENSNANLLGKTIVFSLETEYTFKDRDTYSSITTVGSVRLKGNTSTTTPFATVDFRCGTAKGNPMISYLERHGKLLQDRFLFEKPVTIGRAEQCGLKMPDSNEAYADVSWDFNPIHSSKSLSRYADLPGTITHGMYTSARVRSVIEQEILAFKVGAFRSFECSFTSMVLPGDEILVHTQHIGMIAGRKIIKAEARKRATQEVVLSGVAEVEPEISTYLFTGQGSQKKGMGMDLYHTSASARRVWDLADSHLQENYGFKITDIVRKDPKELTVYFKGARGIHVRKQYMNLVFETTSPDGTIRHEKMFKDITEKTQSHTFRSVQGLLSATQFTQPALTIMELAIFADLRSKGLVSERSYYAGHSLGEYSALVAVADIMPIENLASVVFYRGLTMQASVERDEHGRSEYSMLSVDPSRVSKSFSEQQLSSIVNQIATNSGWLLEIVNYNIARQQYVCAGNVRALKSLTHVLNAIKAEKVVPTANPSRVVDIIHRALETVVKEPQTVLLTRGSATIPLRGVDVPFHSSYLESGVPAFRRYLRRYIPEPRLELNRLVGKYIPNLTAQPFEVSKSYFENIKEMTGSSVLKAVLDIWDSLSEIDEDTALAKLANIVA